MCVFAHQQHFCVCILKPRVPTSHVHQILTSVSLFRLPPPAVFAFQRYKSTDENNRGEDTRKMLSSPKSVCLETGSDRTHTHTYTIIVQNTFTLFLEEAHSRQGVSFSPGIRAHTHAHACECRTCPPGNLFAKTITTLTHTSPKYSRKTPPAVPSKYRTEQQHDVKPSHTKGYRACCCQRAWRSSGRYDIGGPRQTMPSGVWRRRPRLTSFEH